MKTFYKTDHQNDFDLPGTAATPEQDDDRHKLVLIDVKGIFDQKEAQKLNYLYWRL
jgi:UDP-N-acetyl-D-galactosamine dehydrogenase